MVIKNELSDSLVRQIAGYDAKDIKEYYHTFISLFKEMHVLALECGVHYIQIIDLDPFENVITTETYQCRAKDSKTAILIRRDRTGNDHNEMRSYARDYLYPLYSRVKLT